MDEEREEREARYYGPPSNYPPPPIYPGWEWTPNGWIPTPGARWPAPPPPRDVRTDQHRRRQQQRFSGAMKFWPIIAAVVTAAVVYFIAWIDFLNDQFFIQNALLWAVTLLAFTTVCCGIGLYYLLRTWRLVYLERQARLERQQRQELTNPEVMYPPVAVENPPRYDLDREPLPTRPVRPTQRVPEPEPPAFLRNREQQPATRENRRETTLIERTTDRQPPAQ